MPSLPSELERLIFETAALQDTDHDSRVRIILVAKRVYEWIRPIIYRVAVPGESPPAIRGWGNAQTTGVASFTRHLLIHPPINAIEFLSTFRNIENLAIWLNTLDHQHLTKMNDLPLRMLSIILGDINLEDAIKYCPSFRNVTHLEIVYMKLSTWNDCKALVDFPKLTHLSLDHPIKVVDALLLELLDRCPSLLAMIYQVPVDKACSIESDDPRLLVLQENMWLELYIQEWIWSANGQIGLWELSDIIIGARKDNFFKDNLITLSRSTWMDCLNEDGTRWYKERFRECERNGKRQLIMKSVS